MQVRCMYCTLSCTTSQRERRDRDTWGSQADVLTVHIWDNWNMRIRGKWLRHTEWLHMGEVVMSHELLLHCAQRHNQLVWHYESWPYCCWQAFIGFLILWPKRDFTCNYSTTYVVGACCPLLLWEVSWGVVIEPRREVFSQTWHWWENVANVVTTTAGS